ncbi:MAG: thioredoxin domain-containing protein, partial [Blastochloris sp.]|nr:thioredoxin domain-containing protein [Blastochloris sp.]
MEALQLGGERFATLGDPAAPITMVEFSDHGCPYCGRYHQTVFPTIKEQYIDTGKIYYVYKDYPVVSLQGGLAAQAAECAGEQDRYWEMHGKLFETPPEWNDSQDAAIAAFRRYAEAIDVFDRARAILGADLARTEPFTTSVMDGIDIRDTLRHWYEEKIYVKVLPPSRGKLDCVVMLFDSPADPRTYVWRTTWFAEHEEESTLAFYATNFQQEMVGPGIAVANYGGALFLYPPIPIRDIWEDRSLDFTNTLEERLLAAGCKHARSKHVVLLSADGETVIPYDGAQSQSDLWKGMYAMLKGEYTRPAEA